MLKTPERQEIALFSTPVLITSPPGLIVESARLVELAPARDADGAVDLDRLTGMTGLTGAIAADRSFGPTIARFLAAPGRKVTTVGSVQQALAMMEHRRADYTFGYDSELRYFQKGRASAAGLAFVPIAGGQGTIASYIACSRGPVGAAAIEAVNRAMDAHRGALPFLAETQGWFEPEEYRQIQEMLGRHPGDKP